MDAPPHIPLRAARDRVIDLLGIGDTYPLTDLGVPALLKVARGGNAKISIQDAQIGVAYQLRSPNPGDDLSGGEYTKEGRGATLEIVSPEVKEDVTYRIRVAKIAWGEKQAERFLERGAPVKVGIDTTLPLVKILEAQPVPHGTAVNVQVDPTQEGVEYWLIVDNVEATKVTRPGNRGSIVLASDALREDTLIQVRARRFLASGSRTDETAVLDAKVSVQVQANPALAVSVDDSPVDYRQDAAVRIAATQNSARYVAYSRLVADAEYVRDDKSGLQVRPELPKSDKPDGYKQLGEAVAGGGEVRVSVKAPDEDTVVFVQAIKPHSKVWLDQAAVVLVAPDPARALRLRLRMDGARTGDSIQFNGGQPGVFYQLPPQDGGKSPLPAYFHKSAYFYQLDPDDRGKNKGVGQLAIGIDFAIAADPAARPSNPATSAPMLPVVAIQPLAAGASLALRAIKAQTGVETKMTLPAQIPAVPAIRAEAGSVAHGAVARIVVPASNAEDQYQVAREGAPVVIGDGSDLVLEGDRVTADATFEVVVTRLAAGSIRVERVVRVSVLVRPEGAAPAGGQPP